jgi:5'-3' exonuclease
VNKYHPNKIIVCNDYPPYKRSMFYADYKTDRGKLDPEFYEYIQSSREFCYQFLKYLNISLWIDKGYESDDLMGYYVKMHFNENIILVSNDNDLNQLLTITVQIHKKNRLYTAIDFKTEYEIESEDWINILAMCGTHNNIKNLYKGLGEKTALKIFKDKNKFNELLQKYGDQYYKNKKLIELPFDLGITPVIENTEPFSSDREVINYLIKEFGIRITPSMFEAFNILKS